MFIPFLEVNLSEGKPTTQVSTAYAMYASKATDGSLNQLLTQDCSHTGSSQPVWLRVDLQKLFAITRVKIYNLIAFSDRLKNAAIEVAASNDMSKNNRFCAKVPKIFPQDQIQNFDCQPYTSGRYVRLIKSGGYLHVCELQVFGYEMMFYASNDN